MKNLMELKWTDIKDLDKEKSILFVIAAPIEEHSVHLPLGTDLYEAEEWRDEAAQMMKEQMPDMNCYTLPAIPIACASATGFYGCIHFQAKTTYHVAKELLEGLAKMGFRHICMLSGHADPVYLIALEKACKKINKRFGVCAISPMGAFFSAHELGLDLNMPEKLMQTEKKEPDDYHAGWIETSCMLKIRPDLVATNYEMVPATHIQEKDMISSKKQLAAMGKYGHLGSPAMATKELGSLLNQNTAEYIAQVMHAFVIRMDYQKYMFHALYKIPFMHIRYYV